MADEPGRTLLDDLAHPVHRLQVVLERGTVEEADLRDVRRAQARHAALALDRLDHRRLFAADVRPGAAAHVNRRQRARRAVFQPQQFLFQNRTAASIFVPEVDVDLAHARAPGGDQHALEKAVRIALEVPAVLEGSRLALVDVHRHETRLGLRGDDAPLAPRWKAGAAQAAQTGVFHDLGDLFAGAFAGETVGDQLVAAVLLVLRVVEVFRLAAGELLCFDGGPYRLDGGVPDGVLSHYHAGCDFAAADAGRRNHAHLFSKGKILEKRLRTGQIARDGVANPHGEWRRRHLAFLHHFEMVVEGRHLVHLGQRQAHFLRQRGEVRSRQVAVAVVDAVQVLDQQVAAAGSIAQQPPHVLEGLGVDRSALRRRPDFAFHGGPYYQPARDARFLTAVK